MSVIKIRAALETQLNAMSPALATAWENTPYTPILNTPYQRCWLLFGTPDNSEYGANFQENGILQIDLYYPQTSGCAASDARFELIRTAFARGTTLTNGGVNVIIMSTPELRPAYNDGDRFIRPVRIKFYS